MLVSRQWLHGFLDVCLVCLLRDRRDYGLGLIQRLQDAGFGELPAGSLYPALVRLEAAGLITGSRESSSTGPPRKYFELTPEGHIAASSGESQWRSFRAQMDRVVIGADRPVGPS